MTLATPRPHSGARDVARSAPRSRVTGFAGIGYAVGVGVENVDVLEKPGLGSPAGAVRASLLDGAQALVGVVSGGVALVLFVVFAAGLYRRVPGGGGWARAGLVAGVAGPCLAAIGLATDVRLSAGLSGLSDLDVRRLFEIHPRLQLVAGVFVALFLIGFGVAGLRTGALPRLLAWPACLIGAPLLLAPFALFDGSGVGTVLVTVGFGLFSVWVFLTGVWSVLIGTVSGIVFVRRAVFLVLVVAAGLVGAALLVVPAATSTFFSWGLAPPPLAAFAGGAYLGSAVVYAMAMSRPRQEVRGLVWGAAVLSGSVLAVSVAHRDQFDLGRLPSWAWFVLFSGFTLLTTALLVVDRGGGQPRRPLLARWRRLLLVAVASTLGALALVLWSAPGTAAAFGPFEMGPLGARFAGCWVALLATVAGWAAWHGGVAAARLPALALVALPAAMVLGAARTADELRPAGVAVHVVGLVLVLLAGTAVAAPAVRRRGTTGRPVPATMGK
jgi:hypothetical protein